MALTVIYLRDIIVILINFPGEHQSLQYSEKGNSFVANPRRQYDTLIEELACTHLMNAKRGTGFVIVVRFFYLGIIKEKH